MTGHIYRATRGKYVKPVPITKATINWVDEEGNPDTPPKRLKCDHPKHWEWGTGTRNGQKLWYTYSEMFLQKYHLTKKELKEAVDEYDMASLENNNRFICANCARHHASTTGNNRLK